MRAAFKAKRIDAGKYRTRCVVEQPVETVADMHSIEITWTKYADRWMSFDSAWGNELTQAMTTIPQKRGVIRTKYDSQSAAITPRMRIKIGDRILNIEAADDDNGEHREMVMRYLEEAPV
tara:strand:- start:3 stop:362 length:360 start_codon:yes stop_codon:yes gene_type:complete